MLEKRAHGKCNSGPPTKGEIMSAFLFPGYILAVVGGLWLLVVIFQTSVLWGILSLVVPFVSLFFVITNWDETKRPFLIQLAGVILILLGANSAIDAAAVG
jgi:uncharacterized membrane protein